VGTACGIEDRYGLSWWDSLIVAAANRARATRLLTEDLQHGQRLTDPFRVAPDEVLAPEV